MRSYYSSSFDLLGLGNHRTTRKTCFASIIRSYVIAPDERSTHAVYQRQSSEEYGQTPSWVVSVYVRLVIPSTVVTSGLQLALDSVGSTTAP